VGDNGEPLGLVHWLFHPSTWSTSDYCYLEDLFVSPDARGLGIGRALIEHVDQAAKQAGATKVYWLTHESNTTAQAVYDRIPTRTGFIHYERPL
jgi:GNAT superfamily N-acetyltransferase